MSEHISLSETAEVLGQIRAISRLSPAQAAATAQGIISKLDTVTLDIAVTGNTGAGKSSLVNAMRGVEDGEPGAAETGVTETTMEPSKYPHPTMPNVRLWDLPGIGSTNFNAKDYLKKVKFNKYDFFIIVSSGRFGENDLKLATEIQKNKKLFYFVRSKIDQDEEAEKRKLKHNFNLQDMLEKIRNDCEKNLKEIGSPTVFLVSSFYLDMYDFQKLEESLENDLPEHKRNAIVLSLPVYSLEMLKKKEATFQKMAWAASAASAVIAVAPVPGLSVACDVAILVSFLMKCYHAFSLDENSLKKISERLNKPVEEMKAVMKSRFSAGVNEKLIIRSLTSVAIGGLMLLEYLLSNIPGVGSFAAGGISFATTYCLLKKGIEEMAVDAKALLKVAGLE